MFKAKRGICQQHHGESKLLFDDDVCLLYPKIFVLMFIVLAY
jgi:hypothetical protein